MTEEKETINSFLVGIFNGILAREERAMADLFGRTLSIREIHVIGEAFDAVQRGDNTMSELSRRLGVTVGTLTVSVSTLERKGFLLRRRDEEDKRLVRILPSEKAGEVRKAHDAFHRRMVEAIAERLSGEQLAALAASLRILYEFLIKTGEGLTAEGS